MSMENYSIEAAVLAEMLSNNGYSVDGADALSTDDFVDKRHKAIFSAIQEMIGEESVDMVSVTGHLERNGKLSDAGGLAYVAEVFTKTMWGVSFESLVKDLKRKTILRNNQDLLRKSDKALKEGNIEKASAILSDFMEEENLHKSESVNEIAKKFSQFCDDPLTPGIDTGYRDLDRLLGGMQGGDLVILAARPAMGKSAFAVNIMRNMAHNGTNVLMFSFEMSNQQLFTRMVSIESHIEMTRILKKQLEKTELAEVKETARELSKLPMSMYDRADLATVSGISQIAREEKKRGAEFIVIDYLQLMSVPGMNGDNRNGEVSKITRGLKLLAKELDIPILLLSQLSRASEKRTNKVPMLSDLRDSGAIEQDADLVMFLHRPDYYKEDDKKGICEVHIAKHRQGPTGESDLAWVERYTAFKDLDFVEVKEGGAV